MGSGIAQVIAQSGSEVLIYDTRTEALNFAKSKTKETFDKLVAKEKMTADEASTILARMEYVDNLRDLKEVDLVIEAIVENLDAKRSVFHLLDDMCSEKTILASNTSSLSIASLASGVKNPERVIGIHFFNPAPLMPLVEIVPALTTDIEVVEKVVSLVKSWKKVGVVAKDTPGFIVNRVARPYYAEAIKMYEEGVADIATIDWALKTIGGFRMGPFELTDLIGHDVNYVVTETVWKQFFYDPRFRPSITQKRLFEAGLYGRKSGRGFYQYSENAPQQQPTEDEVLGQYIVNRTLALLINEAADALFQNIASAEDIDIAMTKGVNYPKGLLAWADEWGIQTVVDQLTGLFDEFGDDRYRVCPLLKRMAREKRTFHGAN